MKCQNCHEELTNPPICDYCRYGVMPAKMSDQTTPETGLIGSKNEPMPKTIWATDELKKWYRCNMQQGDTEYTRYDVHAEWVQAVGLLSTLHPKLIVDVSDPLSMAKDIELHVRECYEHMEMAWGLIANASGGDWDKESEDWRTAARRWRDKWYELMHPKTVQMEVEESMEQLAGASCGALVSGEVCYGNLVETGLPVDSVPEIVGGNTE